MTGLFAPHFEARSLYGPWSVSGPDKWKQGLNWPFADHFRTKFAEWLLCGWNHLRKHNASTAHRICNEYRWFGSGCYTG
ncbi:hypothetical protein SAMN04488550_0106 [Gordonia malaquae]|nr:hypothetical protein SAMN04488550_0003 [Gordonia malaquae]SEB47746.1 hypothetical protein SAMN04488550_0106 [Gordonia malaquae]